MVLKNILFGDFRNLSVSSVLLCLCGSTCGFWFSFCEVCYLRLSSIPGVLAILQQVPSDELCDTDLACKRFGSVVTSYV
jgi:hypothetical protein